MGTHHGLGLGYGCLSIDEEGCGYILGGEEGVRNSSVAAFYPWFYHLGLGLVSGWLSLGKEG